MSFDATQDQSGSNSRFSVYGLDIKRTELLTHLALGRSDGKSTLAKLQEACLSGSLRYSKVRSCVWKALLGVIPANGSSEEWISSILEQRAKYETFVKDYLIDPTKVENAEVDHPLSSRQDSLWNQFFNDEELRLQIKQDLERLYPRGCDEYFQTPKIRQLMFSILVIWSKLHAQTSYRQGMHELLAPFVWICDREKIQLEDPASSSMPHGFGDDLDRAMRHLMDARYVEADAFALFSKLMEHMEPLFLTPQPGHAKTTTEFDIVRARFSAQHRARESLGSVDFSSNASQQTPILRTCERIQGQLLNRVDPELARHLKKLEILPQMYAIRWMHLLFGREFHIEDVMVVWDVLFADCRRLIETAECFSVALLMFIRDQLLRQDYNQAVMRLMRYPPLEDIYVVVEKVLQLQQRNVFPSHRKLSSVAERGSVVDLPKTVAERQPPPPPPLRLDHSSLLRRPGSSPASSNNSDRGSPYASPAGEFVPNDELATAKVQFISPPPSPWHADSEFRARSDPLTIITNQNGRKTSTNSSARAVSQPFVMPPFPTSSNASPEPSLGKVKRSNAALHCLVQGCQEKRISRGYCHNHLHQLDEGEEHNRNGSIVGPLPSLSAPSEPSTPTPTDDDIPTLLDGETKFAVLFASMVNPRPGGNESWTVQYSNDNARKKGSLWIYSPLPVGSGSLCDLYGQKGTLSLTNYRLAFKMHKDFYEKRATTFGRLSFAVANRRASARAAWDLSTLHGDFSKRQSLPSKRANDVVFSDWEIPLASIARIEKFGKSSGEVGMTIFGKETRVVRFTLPGKSALSERFLNLLIQLAFPETHTHFFAFASAEHESFRTADNGWEVYDPIVEYARLGLVDNPLFRVLSNFDYKRCPSYPAMMIVPDVLTDADMDAIFAFRSRGRIPAIVWRHSTTKAILARSSQPQVGLTAHRCPEDEKLIACLAVLPLNRSSSGSNLLFIVDARKQIAAVGNRAMGKGTENPDNYQCKLVYMNVENIHVVRESYTKVAELCRPGSLASDDSKFWTRLEDTGWLKHIRSLLLSACAIVQLLHNEGVSVLTHCSDGWDRTAQMVALAELILDPFYRTLRGFEILIEKEWCSFGHMFEERCGHGSANISDRQRSPIFIQFLDCVYQILRQFPSAFEFNEEFLLAIVDNVYSCRFGTFLFNCERERQEHSVRQRTVSLWTFINANMSRFVSPIYHYVQDPLYPSVNSKNIRLWESYFFRWDDDFRPHTAPDVYTSYLAPASDASTQAHCV
eukprot:GILJ01011769.1.p1 GENE.GILJ01011769.1~~GILJ01011769.1.p1  ORF type:complete len:1254 (-),score=118.15 GILJ01011769.1:125-3886(-)